PRVDVRVALIGLVHAARWVVRRDRDRSRRRRIRRQCRTDAQDAGLAQAEQRHDEQDDHARADEQVAAAATAPAGWSSATLLALAPAELSFAPLAARGDGHHVQVYGP